MEFETRRQIGLCDFGRMQMQNIEATALSEKKAIAIRSRIGTSANRFDGRTTRSLRISRQYSAPRGYFTAGNDLEAAGKKSG